MQRGVSGDSHHDLPDESCANLAESMQLPLRTWLRSGMARLHRSIQFMGQGSVEIVRLYVSFSSLPRDEGPSEWSAGGKR